MWILVVLFGCASDGQLTGPDGGNALNVEVDPEVVDFGAVAIGEPSRQTLTFHNGGDSSVYVENLIPSPQFAFEVKGIANPKIAAGADLAVTLEWSPDTVEPLDGALDVSVGVKVEDLASFSVPVSGTVSGAALTTSVQSYDMGIVSVGCTGVLDLGLTNSGTADLVVSSVSLVNPIEFTLDDGTGAPLELPLTLAPSASAPVRVLFTPTDEHSTSTTVQIASSDVVAPARNIKVDAEGRIDESNEMFWTVTGQEAMTAIININWGAYTVHQSEIDDGLPLLFELLTKTAGVFRFAIVQQTDGKVVGDTPYIDETFSPEEASAAIDDMMAGLSGDNDYGLQTGVNAMEAQREWLLDEDEQWLDSKFNLVVVNYDVEQSPGAASIYIDKFDTYKDDPGDVAIHGIAGDVPGGCSGGGGFGAEPSPNLYEATIATGGAFISICADDWTKTWETLAAAMLGDVETFVLEGNPAPSTIDVKIDGAQIMSGWTYDAKSKAIVFDEATYPERGSELSVSYIMAVSCE